MLKGNLVARYYYVYAVDYDHGGEWMGQAYMCTRDKEFTIRGIGDCLAAFARCKAAATIAGAKRSSGSGASGMQP